MDALALYEQARAQGTTLAGHYNRNVRVQGDGSPVLVRIRAAASENMDLTLWPEAELLEAVNPYVASAPRLLHAGTGPDFQIHEFVSGPTVEELVPEGGPLPPAVLPAVEGLFGDLLRVPAAALPSLPAHWPRDGDTAGFAELLLGLVREIRQRGGGRSARLYEALGIPGDPCAVLHHRAGNLSRRPFRLLHADIHRKNMILGDAGRIAFLDWELALWGDPVYDLADHLHKMSYTPAERSGVMEGWQRAAPEACRSGWQADLDYYLAYEAVKSAVVDAVRWGRRIAASPEPEVRRSLAGELADKITAARPHWEPGTARPPGLREIEAAAERWAG
ncbi:hypothetical protein AMK16_28610 [Streptomyces sp. CB00455]|uniref:aminoglycoside phosphotransferase family protein n=1 Tax=Streptomyces sp. CB00455 TaxID=1703927 RepID=UPI00093E3EC7|nr:aminoglycoside phosphotransferase family protein [Streptomyces sp. CB00455]OKK15198.1 hypothetical protein AMK16_28610 [Streptomyces sp. CB00455]